MATSLGQIYLDNAATTRVIPEVGEVVSRCMGQAYGNPSSAHHFGIEAERAIKVATRELARAIGDRDGDLGDLIWTSGGTEADAIGVIGPARRAHRRGKHVLYSAIEHPAVTNSAAMLGDEGWDVGELAVAASGAIDVEAALAAVTEATTVVAVMLVNNEIGTVQPVAELARRIKAARADVHVHCDAVQAVGKITVDVRALGVDSVAMAAHKFHGPKGVGALWLRRGASLSPLWGGGGQQGGARPGTLNVPGIAGMGAAARLASAGLAERAAHFAALGDRLVAAARDCGVEYCINGEGAERAPHILSLAFKGVPAEPLLHVLESRGVMVSAGSACSERDRKPSPVLRAIGLGREFGTVRLSFGRETTTAEVEKAAEILRDAVRSFK